MKKTHIILDKLHHITLTTTELIEGFVPSYQETYRAMRRKMMGNTYPERMTFKQWQRQQEKSFYTLLSRLKKDGLVKKQKLGLESVWQITSKGIEKLKVMEDKSITAIPKKSYKIIEDSDWNLIIFDIPEKFKRKRIWLREQLKDFGFTLLQKSVWIGKYKIPEEFIYDLRHFGLLSYVHILKIQKKGSLTNLEL